MDTLMGVCWGGREKIKRDVHHRSLSLLTALTMIPYLVTALLQLSRITRSSALLLIISTCYYRPQTPAPSIAPCLLYTMLSLTHTIVEENSSLSLTIFKETMDEQEIIIVD